MWWGGGIFESNMETMGLNRFGQNRKEASILVENLRKTSLCFYLNYQPLPPDNDLWVDLPFSWSCYHWSCQWVISCVICLKQGMGLSMKAQSMGSVPNNPPIRTSIDLELDLQASEAKLLQLNDDITRLRQIKRKMEEAKTKGKQMLLFSILSFYIENTIGLWTLSSNQYDKCHKL